MDIKVYGSDGNLLRHRSGEYDSKGQLKELRQYFDACNYSVNKFEYDTYGNIKSVADSRGATLSYTYDKDENMFITEIAQSGKGTDTYTSIFEYDPATQAKTMETDCSGNSLRYEYDSWQRVKEGMTEFIGETLEDLLKSTPKMTSLYTFYEYDKKDRRTRTSTWAETWVEKTQIFSKASFLAL